jgi:hypothetical protein
MRENILSPKQQIRLHFRCLVREHRFNTLGWHLKGIRRALLLLDTHKLRVVRINGSPVGRAGFN